MGFEPIGGGDRDSVRAQPGKPSRLLVESDAKSGAREEQKRCRHEQFRLPFESKKCPQRKAAPPRRAVRAGDAPHVFLKAEKRIAGDTEPGEEAF